MASSDAKVIAVKNQPLRITFVILDADGDPVTGAAGLDSEVSKDGAAFADCSNEATEIGNGFYYLDLIQAEMNADTVAVAVKTSTTGAKQTNFVIYTAARTINDLAFPTVSGRSIDVSTGGEVGLDWANIGSPTTTVGLTGTTVDLVTDAVDGNAIAASGVTEIQSGLATSAALATVAGYIDTEIADIQSRLPAALVSGRMDCSVGAMATDVVTSGAMSAGAVTEIQSGLATSSALSTAQADLDDIQTRLPAALVGGRIDASVGAMANNTLTAAAMATDAGTEIADAVWNVADAEETSVPAANAAMRDKVNHMFMMDRNAKSQDATTETIYQDDGTTVYATSTKTAGVGTLAIGEVTTA